MISKYKLLKNDLKIIKCKKSNRLRSSTGTSLNWHILYWHALQLGNSRLAHPPTAHSLRLKSPKWEIPRLAHPQTAHSLRLKSLNCLYTILKFFVLVQVFALTTVLFNAVFIKFLGSRVIFDIYS